jgi:hypothetical protein
MTEPRHQKWASVYCNGDFYNISSKSGYRIFLSDPSGFEIDKALDVTDEELGKTVLEAISHSRFIRPEAREEFEQFFSPARIAASYATWVASLLEKYKYKTRRNLFKNMALCHIAATKDEIEISPMRHEKLESWTGLKSEGIEDVVLPAHSSPEEVGKALRTAFGRCK